jgi:hypothetical protein
MVVYLKRDLVRAIPQRRGSPNGNPAFCGNISFLIQHQHFRLKCNGAATGPQAVHETPMSISGAMV